MTQPNIQTDDQLQLVGKARTFTALTSPFLANGIWSVKVRIQQEGLSAEAVLPALFFEGQ